MFLLVPAYPGCTGPKAVKRLCVCNCIMWLLYIASTALAEFRAAKNVALSLGLQRLGALGESGLVLGRLGSRVVSVLDSGAEGPGFKSQPRRCRVTVLGKLFTPIVPLFTKQQNWYQPS